MNQLFALSSLLVISTAAGPLIEAADHVYSTLTGHAPTHTVPYQVLNAASSLSGIGTSRILSNWEKRRLVNALAFRNNMDGIVHAAEAVRDSAEKTYLGAGVFGAAGAFRDILTNSLVRKPMLGLPVDTGLEAVENQGGI